MKARTSVYAILLILMMSALSSSRVLSQVNDLDGEISYNLGPASIDDMESGVDSSRLIVTFEITVENHGDRSLFVSLHSLATGPYVGTEVEVFPYLLRMHPGDVQSIMVRLSAPNLEQHSGPLSWVLMGILWDADDYISEPENLTYGDSHFFLYSINSLSSTKAPVADVN